MRAAFTNYEEFLNALSAEARKDDILSDWRYARWRTTYKQDRSVFGRTSVAQGDPQATEAQGGWRTQARSCTEECDRAPSGAGTEGDGHWRQST